MAEFVFLSWSVGCERGGVPTAGRSQSQDSAPVFDLPSKDVASGVRMLPFDFASIRKRAGGRCRCSLLAPSLCLCSVTHRPLTLPAAWAWAHLLLFLSQYWHHVVI